MVYWILSVLASTFMCITSFIKSNGEETIGFKINPFAWWLVMGWVTAYVGMTNWQFVKTEIGPLKALVFFTIFQVVFEVIAYSVYFGWQPKYVIAVLLVALAGAIIST